MTTTLSNPNTATLRMDGAASLTIVMYGKATIAFTSANDDVWPSFTVTNAQSKTYGPYGINMSVVITALDGSLTYQVNGGVPGFGYDADSNITYLVDAAGNALPSTGATVTATGSLPASALGKITPYNSGSAGVLTLPDAATAWAEHPYGLIIVVQKGAGAASFLAGGSDTLRATSGITAGSVQYGMIAAQVQSATEWALA